jgi:hypothetical protein
MEYRGDTCTGEVTSVNKDTREIILPVEQVRAEDRMGITITQVFTDPGADLKHRHGKPEEMKGLTKVFIDSGTDPKDRERIVKVIESAKLGLTVLDSAEGAEIILNFVGGERQTTDDYYNAVTKIYAPLPVTVGFGRGVVYVVRGNRRRAVLSFQDDGGNHFFPKKLATNFGKKFVKAYRRAHRAK